MLRDALARGSCANIFYLPMVTKLDGDEDRHLRSRTESIRRDRIQPSAKGQGPNQRRGAVCQGTRGYRSPETALVPRRWWSVVQAVARYHRGASSQRDRNRPPVPDHVGRKAPSRGPAHPSAGRGRREAGLTVAVAVRAPNTCHDACPRPRRLHPSTCTRRAIAIDSNRRASGASTPGAGCEAPCRAMRSAACAILAQFERRPPEGWDHRLSRRARPTDNRVLPSIAPTGQPAPPVDRLLPAIASSASPLCLVLSPPRSAVASSGP